MEITANNQTGKLPYPGLVKDSPTIFDLFAWMLTNQGLVVGDKLEVSLEEDKK